MLARLCRHPQPNQRRPRCFNETGGFSVSGQGGQSHVARRGIAFLRGHIRAQHGVRPIDGAVAVLPRVARDERAVASEVDDGGVASSPKAA